MQQLLVTIRKVKMIAFGLFLLIASSRATPSYDPSHPLSDEFIDHLNSLQTTWKAGRNFAENTPLSHLKHLLGALEDDSHRSWERVHHVRGEDEVIPESFDAREKWPECESIRMIRDQSNCGSCWAVSATAVMSDRICIASNGTDQTLVSSQDLITCCPGCGSKCAGGFPNEAWAYWKSTGIVSGGPYNSSTGCKAYTMEPCVHEVKEGAFDDLPSCELLKYPLYPKCIDSCDEGSTLSYNQSRSYASSIYVVGADDEGFVEEIQLEIMRNGPVQAVFEVYIDFFTYRSGVYQQPEIVNVEDSCGLHAVRIIGWGVENEIPYWLITNSWNEGWGDNGLFKIRRGEDDCGIESQVVAGLPRL